MQTIRTQLRPLAAFGLALGLAACAPAADTPAPGEPGSPIGPEQAGGPPPPQTSDTDPVQRAPGSAVVR
jgi:hypothetical protein